VYKVLAVEGIDCSGKTTFIAELRRRLGLSRSHPLIIDRFVYSNYVFERMGGRDRTAVLQEALDKFIANFPLVTVYLDIPTDLAYERMQSKKDDFKYTKEDLDDMKILFEEAFQTLGGVVHKINMDYPERGYRLVMELLE